jgi:hypothetical protein
MIVVLAACWIMRKRHAELQVATSVVPFFAGIDTSHAAEGGAWRGEVEDVSAESSQQRCQARTATIGCHNPRPFRSDRASNIATGSREAILAACTADPAIAVTKMQTASSDDSHSTISPESEDVVMRALDLRSSCHQQSLSEDDDEDFVLYVRSAPIVDKRDPKSTSAATKENVNVMI